MINTWKRSLYRDKKYKYNMEVRNKVCIITDSARGLGKALAKILLHHGAMVCISDMDEKVGLSTFEEFKTSHGQKNVWFVKCDVTSEKEFTNLFDETENYFQVDCVDMLVNNAGINTNLGWRKCIEVNLIGVMIGSEIAMKRMRKHPNKGSVINTGSLAAMLTGAGEFTASYMASKAGVLSLTRTLANEFHYHGVSNKAILLAWADTDIMSLSDETPSHIKASIEKSVDACGGMMTTEYVAEGFHQLVSGCDNGSIMMVVKNTPFTLIPDNGKSNLLQMVLKANILGKVLRKKFITETELKVFGLLVPLVTFIIFCVILCFINWYIFSNV